MQLWECSESHVTRWLTRGWQNLTKGDFDLVACKVGTSLLDQVFSCLCHNSKFPCQNLDNLAVKCPRVI